MTTTEQHAPATVDIDRLCIDTIRTLSMDAVEQANSGHPGLPMAMAPAAYLLYTRFMRHNPKNPEWPDRDRFVLSAGHGSMLLYATLHLAGYDLPMEEIKNFRQLGSKTPGHPERDPHNVTPGVEVTTGPLGQGFANGVGMAIAERFEAYGWHTLKVDDVNDLDELSRAIQAAIDEEERPSLIKVRSIIGWPAPHKQGTSKAHGSPLGEDEVRATKEILGWDPDKTF